MKKLFSLMAIAAVALTSITSCGEPKTPETPPVAKAKLTLSADAKVAVEATGKFAVTSNIDAASDIAVTVKSSDEKILTITTASVTIANGKKSVEGSFKGVANGKAKIEITAADVTLSVASVEVTVGGTQGPAEIHSGTSGMTISKDEVWASIKTDGDYTSSIYCFDTDWSGTAGKALRISIDNYGAKIVGKKESFGLVFTFVEKDTPIDEKLAWVENTDHADGYGDNGGADWMCEPYIWVDGEYTDLEGKEGYIVSNFMSKNGDEEVRGWVYVKVQNGSVTVGDFAYAITDGEFKVGQTK